MKNAATFEKNITYVRIDVILYEQLGPISICMHPKYEKFYFQNLGNGREDKKGRR